MKLKSQKTTENAFDKKKSTVITVLKQNKVFKSK